MAVHSHVKIWVHLIWGTQKKERVLHRDLRINLFEHIVKISGEEEIEIEKMNIQPEHVHLLFCLPSDKSIGVIAKKFKGESSHWINDGNLTKCKFRWQRGYGAFSVSASQLDRIKKYIENQDEHHKRQSFKEEYDEWARKYGVFEDI